MITLLIDRRLLIQAGILIFTGLVLTFGLGYWLGRTVNLAEAQWQAPEKPDFAFPIKETLTPAEAEQKPPTPETKPASTKKPPQKTANKPIESKANSQNTQTAKKTASSTKSKTNNQASKKPTQAAKTSNNAPQPVAKKPEAKPTKSSQPATASTPTPEQKAPINAYTVQVGFFRSENNANSLKSKLEDMGFANGFVTEGKDRNGSRFLVFLGNYATYDTANKALSDYQGKANGTGVVIKKKTP